jgi:hypothetical protein
MSIQEQLAEALRLYKVSLSENDYAKANWTSLHALSVRYGAMIEAFKNYKNISKSYIELLNSQDKSINPFLKDKDFVIEEYKLESLPTKENLEKIAEYTSIILMDFIKIKESNYISQGFYKRLEWRTSMLKYYRLEWLRSRVKKEVAEGGIGEDLSFPDESENDYENLENKKLSTLRKIHVCSRKLIDNCNIHYEVKLQLLLEKYQAMTELYPYEEDL